MSSFVSLEDVKKIYQMGEVQIMAAAGIDFQIERGEFAVVVGPKWCRKDDSIEYSWRNGYGKSPGVCSWTEKILHSIHRDN